SLNAVDWYGFSGRPYLARPLMGLRGPKSGRVGSDFAGVVVAAGGSANGLVPGDEVYGCQSGAFAECLVAGAGVARKPASPSVEESAAVRLRGLAGVPGLLAH